MEYQDEQVLSFQCARPTCLLHKGTYLIYQERLLKHLTDYRLDVLGIETPGLYRHRGTDLPKGHILPTELKWHNILPSVRDQVQSFIRQRKHIKLHKYFHHLNSSQAFALNLFVPYFEGDPMASNTLLRALGQEGDLSSWDMEAIPDPMEETNIDVIWSTTSNVNTVCEVKLSEAEFGTAIQDEKHLNKIRNTYSLLLKEHLPASLLEPAVFCAHYQIFRNVWHMLRLENGRLLFLLPQANSKLWASLHKFIKRFPKSIQLKMSAVSAEDVIERLSTNPVVLKEHAKELRVKYMCLDKPV